MDSVLDCIVCKDHYDYDAKLPLILSCGHTFCKDCLVNLGQFESIIRCPIDRELEWTAINKLPINLALLQVQELAISGLKSKERCRHHRQPISLVCRTCNTSCCISCVRKHKNHDLSDPESPKILQEVSDKIKISSSEVKAEYAKTVEFDNSLAFEIEQLSQQRNKLTKHVTDIFDKFRLESDTKEHQSNLEVSKLVQSRLNYLYTELVKLTEQKKYFQGLTDKLQLIKKNFNDSSYLDRSITCNNMLDELDNIKEAKTPNISSLKTRFSIDFSQIINTRFGDLQCTMQSPFDTLRDECNKTMKKLGHLLNSYNRGNPEEKLCIQVQSMPVFILTTTQDFNIAQAYVAIYLLKKTLGVKTGKIDSALVKELPDLLGVSYDFSEFKKGLTEKVKYCIGIVNTAQLIIDKDWENALKLLHFLIIKFHDFSIAEHVLKALLLKITEEIAQHIRKIRIERTIQLLKLVTEYLHFHFLPSEPVYVKMVEIFKLIMKVNDRVLTGMYYALILHQIEDNLEILYGPCYLDIPVEVAFSSSMKQIETHEFLYWKNKDIPTKLENSMRDVRNVMRTWWSTVQIPYLSREQQSIFN